MILALITSALFCLLSGFWECEELSTLTSYHYSDAVVACEIKGFHFESERLILELNTYDQFKQDTPIHEVFYDHASAFSDYQSGMKWMQNMANGTYIINVSEPGRR